MTGNRDRVPSLWEEKVAADPGHSQWYLDRFRRLVAAGEDIVGEARTVDAMVGRGARILDAGCGFGRIGGHLAACSHTVVGVDVDPVLIEAAAAAHPDATWLVGDLAELDLPAHGIPEPFDAIVCAGNVLPFAAPSTRGEVVRRFAVHLRPGGRAIVGFGLDRGYSAEEFLHHVQESGLAPELLLATWDLEPFTPESEFIVAILRRIGVAAV